MQLSKRWLGTSLALTSVALVAGCTPKEAKYESVCQITREEVVETDAQGKPELVDLELEWDPCPGDQFQVVRGGREFAQCIMKYKVGDYVPVHVLHEWDARGYYKWDLFQIGDCQRPIERTAEGSYEKSQECVERKAYGRPVGFTCSRKPFRQLVKVCPWMARD